MLQNHLKRLLHERNGGGLFFFLLRVVKTKNSHILSLPFRGLLGLAYSSALICKWAACFPAGDTGRHPRNTEEMSCQESSPAASNRPWAAPRAKLVFWLKNKNTFVNSFSFQYKCLYIYPASHLCWPIARKQQFSCSFSVSALLKSYSSFEDTIYAALHFCHRI